MPRTASFEDTESAISYETVGENEAALITYSYHGVNIGSIRVNFAVTKNDTHLFDTLPDASSDSVTEQKQENSVIVINVLRVLAVLAGIALLLLFILLIRALLKNYAFSGRNSRRIWRKNRRRHRRRSNRIDSGKFRDYD